MSQIVNKSVQIGQALRDRRLAAKLSQADVSRAAGLGRTTLIHLEQGSKDVRLANVLAAAEAVGATFALQAESPVLAERRRLRLEEALKLAGRREAHMRLAAQLSFGDPKGLRALDEARRMLALWKRDHTCSEFYIEGWSKVLRGSATQVARAMLAIESRWVDAMLQNTPFPRLSAQS